MALLTNRDLAVFCLGSCSVDTQLQKAIGAIQRQGGDINLLPDAVRDLAYDLVSEALALRAKEIEELINNED